MLDNVEIWCKNDRGKSGHPFFRNLRILTSYRGKILAAFLLVQNIITRRIALISDLLCRRTSFNSLHINVLTNINR